MWLNCKVIKKWQPPPRFTPPVLAKNFVPPPQVTQFLEGPKAGGGGGGSNYVTPSKVGPAKFQHIQDVKYFCHKLCPPAPIAIVLTP